MNLYPKYQQGLPYKDFVARYANDVQRERWRLFHEQVALSPAQGELLAAFRCPMPVLVLAGAWCGDCINQCPIFEHFAKAAPVIQTRYIDRDEHADAQRELQVNGGNRVPVVVFFSEDGMEVARYGERTLSSIGNGCAIRRGQVAPPALPWARTRSSPGCPGLVERI